MGFKRYQRGSVYKSGKRGKQVWVGMWREDVPNAEGGFNRRQRKVKLGTMPRFQIVPKRWNVFQFSCFRNRQRGWLSPT